MFDYFKAWGIHSDSGLQADERSLQKSFFVAIPVIVQFLLGLHRSRAGHQQNRFLVGRHLLQFLVCEPGIHEWHLLKPHDDEFMDVSI